MKFEYFANNILYNILTCLTFKERYQFCITSKYLFYELFKKYQHQELFEIKLEDHLLIKIWNNIKFKMDLSRTNITDVSILGNIHTLRLVSCNNIEDVSMLGNVHTLNLSVTNITDVSMLGNVHTLNLFKCNNFKACLLICLFSVCLLSRSGRRR